MKHIVIDDSGQVEGCTVCCCEVVSIRPGAVLPLQLNYAPWAVPIAPRGLHCEPAVEIEEKDTCPSPTGSNSLPTAPAPVVFSTAANTELTGDLNTFIADAESSELTFKLMSLYGPKHGTLNLLEDGTFTYMPNTNWKGVDRFFITASDGANAPVPFEAMIAVGVAPSTAVGTPPLSVGTPVVDQRYYIVTLPIAASPLAKPCQVFRLTIRQGALDCDCNCYYHVDCIDVRIAKC